MSRDKITVKNNLLKQLEKTPIIEAACKQVGLPRSTYYRWRKEDDSFAETCDETIELSVGRINDLAESQLINAIKDRNMSAITFWLKHHHSSYRNKIELNANISSIQQELSPEQASTVATALKLAGLTAQKEAEDE